jgi:hypothetical protein
MAPRTPKPPVETSVGPDQQDQAKELAKEHAAKVAEAAAEVQAEATIEAVPESIVEAANRIFADDQAKRPIIVKLARIMESLPELKPEGRNQHFGYQFIRDTQVSGALRRRLAEERVMIVPDVVSEEWVETKTGRGGTSWVTKLKVRYTAIDGDSGDMISGHGFGYGDDAGDKGANKAMTAALKYWLLKLFQIGGEDSDDDARADQRAGEREAGQSEPTSVNVEGATITGVQRGGRSDRSTATQHRQITALVRDMMMSAENFIGLIRSHDMKIEINPEETDAGPAIKAWLAALSADDAGQLISWLVEEKDKDAADADDIPEENGAGGGYG